MQETSFRSVRGWMQKSYEKNKDFLHEEVLSYRKGFAPKTDLSDHNTLVGAICLTPIKQSIKCFAADQQELADSFLQIAIKTNDHAVKVCGGHVERDEEDIDRVQIAIANRLLLGLSAPETVQKWNVPFESFPTYINNPDREPEEKIAAKVIWALLGVLEARVDEYEKARQIKSQRHPDLNQELDLIPFLADLSKNPSHEAWSPYEQILARWLNPIIRMDSNATLFRDDFAALLVLFWAKFKMGRADREKILATYFGENLSIQVHVQ